MKNINTITIQNAVNGYVVNVGCKMFVISSKDELLDALDKYLTNPEETEKRYREEYPGTFGMPEPPRAVMEDAPYDRPITATTGM